MGSYTIDLDGLRKTVNEGIEACEKVSFDDDGLRDYLGDEAYAACIKLVLSADMASLVAACICALFKDKTGKITVIEGDPDYDVVDYFMDVLLNTEKNSKRYRKIIYDRLAELAG